MNKRTESLIQVILLLLALIALFRTGTGLPSDTRATISIVALAVGTVLSLRLLFLGSNRVVALLFAIFFCVYTTGLALSLLLGNDL